MPSVPNWMRENWVSSVMSLSAICDVHWVLFILYAEFKSAIVTTWRNGEGVPPPALRPRERGLAPQVTANKKIDC